MNQQRSLEMEEIFSQLRELPEAEQQAFLDQQCQGDEALQETLRSLLEADRDAGRFLGDLTAEGEPEEAFRSGQVLGAYRLGPVLGEGGMSTVYQADRIDGAFERQVVIKVVRRGMESPDALDRLRAERSILAALEHPHIARLYDGGATEKNAPYFAMEWVEGKPIDVFCAEGMLSVAERLILVRQVCSAVAWAHRHLVVHRDLKPSNILVTTGGEVRLLDFGIAKILDSSAIPENRTETAAWVRRLTPHYASPEQVRGETVTTASDIYSLGVLLCRLLTGRLPFDRKRRSLRQLEEDISTGPLPKASDLTESREAARSVGVGLDEKAHRRLLEGDLDTIILRCLQVDPARRYPSAQRLEEDLGRYLAGLPVWARGDSWSYRAGKFLRRHRLAVAAAAVISVLVLGQVWTFVRHERELGREKDRVTEALQRKTKTIELTQELFRVAADGEALSVGQAVRRASARIDRLFAGEPETQGELLNTAGAIFLHLGAPGEARGLLERAADLHSRTAGEGSLPWAQSLTHLGAAKAYASSLEADGAVAEQLVQDGLADLRSAMRSLRRLLDPQDVRLIAPLNYLVQTLCRLEDYAAADEPSREALRTASTQLPEAAPQRARAATNRVVVLRGLSAPNSSGAPALRRELSEQERLARTDDLLEAYREALSSLELAFGEEHPETAVVVNNLGLHLWRLGRVEEAETYLRRSLETTVTLSGVDHPEAALPGRNLGSLLLDLGRLQEALEVSSRSREILLSSPEYGMGFGLTAACTADVASALNRLGRPEEVQELIREEVALWRARGVGNLPLAFLESALGESLGLLGDEQQAEMLLSRSLEAFLSSRGEDYPDTRRTRSRLAALHSAP